MQLPEFLGHLNVEMNKKKTNLHMPYLCVSRILAVAEPTPGPQPHDFPEVGDPRFLVGIWLSGVHKKIMALNIMSPKYTWAMDTMKGLVLYCEYHKSNITKKKLHGEEGFWDEYIDALTQMTSELMGGHWKRCQDMVAVNLNRKRREDLAKLKKFPPIDHRNPKNKHKIRQMWNFLI